MNDMKNFILIPSKIGNDTQLKSIAEHLQYVFCL